MLYIAGTKSASGEYVIIATNKNPDTALALQRNLYIDLRGLALLPPDFLFNCKLSNGKSACPQLRQVVNF